MATVVTALAREPVSELAELQQDLCCDTGRILDDPFPAEPQDRPAGEHELVGTVVVVREGLLGRALFVAVHLDGEHDLGIGEVDEVALSADTDLMLVAVRRQSVARWTDVEAELEHAVRRALADHDHVERSPSDDHSGSTRLGIVADRRSDIGDSEQLPLTPSNDRVGDLHLGDDHTEIEDRHQRFDHSDVISSGHHGRFAALVIGARSRRGSVGTARRERRVPASQGVHRSDATAPPTIEPRRHSNDRPRPRRPPGPAAATVDVQGRHTRPETCERACRWRSRCRSAAASAAVRLAS